jgi:hypothetical protein
MIEVTNVVKRYGATSVWNCSTFTIAERSNLSFRMSMRPSVSREGLLTLQSSVAYKPLARDTSAEIEQLQIARWREMSGAQKVAIVSGLSRASQELALAGIRHRYPHAGPREQFLRLAILNLGLDLARRAYPEIDDLIER